MKYLLLALVMLAACGGDIYEPCVEPSDCDPEFSDGCATQGSKSWCAKICEEAADCPPGPDGEAPSCIAVDRAGSKVCSIP